MISYMELLKAKWLVLKLAQRVFCPMMSTELRVLTITSPSK